MSLNPTSVRVLQAVERLHRLTKGPEHVTTTVVQLATGLGETTTRDHLKSLTQGGFLERYHLSSRQVAYRPLRKEHDVVKPKRVRRTKAQIQERDQRVLELLQGGAFTRVEIATRLDMTPLDVYHGLRRHARAGAVQKVRDGSRTPLWTVAS